MLVFERSRSVFYVLRPDLSQARSIRPNQRSAGISATVLEWPNAVLVSSTTPAAPGTYDSYGVVDMSGPDAVLLESFGSDRDAPPAGRSSSFFRSQTPAAGDQVWTWRPFPYPYRVERWSSDGVRTATLERESSWYPSEWPGSRWWPDGEPPPPQVRTFREDAAARLWVFIDVAAPTWPEGMPPWPEGARAVEIPGGTIQMEKLYQTLVEVIDPGEGRVIAQSRIDGWVISALSGDRAAIYGTTPIGIPFIRIVQLNFTQ